MGHAIVSLMKAAVGAGSFALPAGFLKGGLWASFAGLIFLGFLCAYTLKVVLRTSSFCENSRNGSRTFYVD
jgi:amino acid permease